MSCVRPFICATYATQRNHHPQTVTISGCYWRINFATADSDGTIEHALYFHSVKDFRSWIAAFRLSRWEKSRLDEIYTAHLIRTTVNDGRNAPSTLTDGRLEGWVRVKAHPYRGEWKRLWMCVSAATVANAVAPSLQHRPWSSSYTASRGKSNDPPRKAGVFLYNGKRRGGEKGLVLEFSAITKAFAVYPERPELISTRAPIKLRGMYYERNSRYGNKYKGCMLLMPDLEGAGIEEMLRWLIGERVPFAKSFWVSPTAVCNPSHSRRVQVIWPP